MKSLPFELVEEVGIVVEFRELRFCLWWWWWDFSDREPTLFLLTDELDPLLPWPFKDLLQQHLYDII